MTYKPRILTCF